MLRGASAPRRYSTKRRTRLAGATWRWFMKGQARLAALWRAGLAREHSVALLYEELEKEAGLAGERSVALFYEETSEKGSGTSRATLRGAIFYEETR